MREPKVSDLKFDRRGTSRIRSEMSKAEVVKITINIDAMSLQMLKTISARTGIPYQRLLNRFLKESLVKHDKTESRLSRLEAEVQRMKRKLAA